MKQHHKKIIFLLKLQAILLPSCNFSVVQTANIKTQLSKATFLLESQRKLNEAKSIYSTIDDQLIQCDSTLLFDFGMKKIAFTQGVNRTSGMMNQTNFTFTTQTPPTTIEAVNVTVLEEAKPPTFPTFLGSALSIILAIVTAVLATMWKKSRKKVSV